MKASSCDQLLLLLLLTYIYKQNTTCFEMGNQNPKKTSQRGFQLDKIDEKRFFSNLEVQKDLIQSALAQAKSSNPSNNNKVLDKSAEIITTAIFLASN